MYARIDNREQPCFLSNCYYVGYYYIIHILSKNLKIIYENNCTSCANGEGVKMSFSYGKTLHAKIINNKSVSSQKKKKKEQERKKIRSLEKEL